MRNIFIRYTFATSKRNNQTLLILYLIIMKTIFYHIDFFNTTTQSILRKSFYSYVLAVVFCVENNISTSEIITQLNN